MKIAIVGATGNVGRKLVEICIQRQKIAPQDLRLFASEKSAGLKLEIAQHLFSVSAITADAFKDCTLAIFATETDVSQQYVPLALAAGAIVVDASSQYRLDPQVPLIVPPVNAALMTRKHRLYAHANCLASPIAVALKPLHDYAQAKRVLVSTYQSVSGAGKAAMDELYTQTKAFYEKKPCPPQCFPRPIAFNVIPQVGKILDDGFAHEEFKIAKEVQKIISPDIKISATAVRVPVMIGHSISLSIEFTKSIDMKEMKTILAHSPGITLSPEYSTPLEVVGKDNVFVGRIRRDDSIANGVLLWLVSDNLRRGAALDEAEMAEKILALR